MKKITLNNINHLRASTMKLKQLTYIHKKNNTEFPFLYDQILNQLQDLLDLLDDQKQINIDHPQWKTLQSFAAKTVDDYDSKLSTQLCKLTKKFDIYFSNKI